MREPATPPDEAARLARLRELGILDTQAEPRFDRITRIVRQVLQVPIALVSLIDRDRQWFKSRAGLEATETPRTISFCGHTILGDDPFVIPDASRDGRFADNPLVTGPPDIRFYAGFPLASPEGLRVGTLCAISPQPRDLTCDEAQLMRDLADLVERELFFADLAMAQEAVAAAAAAKAAFLAEMAHEIRTPVHAVAGAAELLDSASRGSEDAELVETIRTGAEMLRSLVGSILDLSKIEAGKLELEERAFALDDLVHGILRLVSTSAHAKGVEVVLEGDVGGVQVVGDEVRLRQVLLNLLQNAVKFTDVGRVTLRIRREGIDTDRADREPRFGFAVEDTGIGISDDRLDQVFEEFTQAEASTTRRFGGTGLGLAISRRLVERMGGSLRAESEVGRGSCFHFSLPLPEADSAVRGSVARLESVPQGLRILLVDDTPSNHRVTSAQASRLGHELVAVGSGAEALEVLAASPAFDLVLMDLDMPGMDGVETTKRLRARDGDALPVVAMTASAREEDRRRCLDAGMDAFLPKPVRLQDLETCLHDVLTGRCREAAKASDIRRAGGAA